MDNPTLIIALAMATLIIVVAVLIYQRLSVKNAQDKKHHSAMTSGKPEQRDH